MKTREFELQYPNGPYIARGLTEGALQKFKSTLEINVRDIHTGWVWYRLPSFQDDSMKIGIELGFHQGILREIMVFHDDTAIYGKDWNDWSEKREQLRAETTKSWFQIRGFRPGSYPWGEIWSAYDPKSGLGGGGVRYAR